MKSLLKRFRSGEPAAKAAAAPSAEAITTKADGKTAASDSINAACTSQKKSKKVTKLAGVDGSTPAAAASAQNGSSSGAPHHPPINKLSEVAPRVDLSILRQPSPPLVDVPLDGYRANSPWVDLAADVEPPRRGSFGFGLGASSSSSPTSRAVNEKLQDYLNEKRISPKQATILVRECSKVLQGQGIETLGIFRPWRLAESPYIIARTLALFFKAICPNDNVPLEERDLLGFGRGDGDALAAFTDALEDAGTHNVVACLKWGLRHLQDSSSGDPDCLSKDPWTVYRSFLQDESEKNYDGSAYTSTFLPKLPKEHGSLLAVCLELIAAVATHDTQNAMPGLHLCRLLAFWIFGRHRETFLTWTSLYNDYLVAAGCLEHIFLAYLRQDRNLPMRLQDLIALYPAERLRLAEAVQNARLSKAEDLETLHVTLASSAPANPRIRSPPGALLASALQAGFRENGDIVGEVKPNWEQLVERTIDGEGDGIDLQSVVVDETERIFGVVAERAEKAKRVRINSDRRTVSYGNRRRSLSMDVGMMQSVSSKSSGSTGRNRALSNDARMPSSPSQSFDLSWGDFETKGFSDDFDSDNFSLFSEVGRPSIDSEAVSHRPPQKLKKPYPYASLASRHLEFGRRYRPGQGEEGDASPVLYEIKDLRVTKVDPVFIEMYLDSLEDPSVTSHWPAFVVADLKDIGNVYKAVVVELSQPVPSKSATGLASAAAHLSNAAEARPEIGHRPSKRQKTGFFSLGSRRKQTSASKLDTQLPTGVRPPAITSTGQPGLGIDELGQLQRTTPAAGFLLPDQSRRQSVPTIIKTSPLTPPRRHNPLIKTVPKQQSIPEHESERRPSPSPTQSSGSLGKKVSRKPVPELEDEDVILAEVSKEAAPSKENAQIEEDDEHLFATAQQPQLKTDETVPATHDDSVAREDQAFPEEENTDIVRAKAHSILPVDDTANIVPKEDEEKEAPAVQPSRKDTPREEEIAEEAAKIAAYAPLTMNDRVVEDSHPVSKPVEAVEDSHHDSTELSRPTTPIEATREHLDIPTVIIEDTDSVDEAPTEVSTTVANDSAVAHVDTASDTVPNKESAIEAHPTSEVQPTGAQDPATQHDTPILAATEDPHIHLAEDEAEESKVLSTIEEANANNKAILSHEVTGGQDTSAQVGENAASAKSGDAVAPVTEDQRDDNPAGTTPGIVSAVSSAVQDEPAQPTDDDVKTDLQPTTPKRFGNTLNRVSPSLKERFGTGGKSQAASPEQDLPKEKVVKAQAPPSPSRRAALLSGAKKMLSRKKSAPSGTLSPKAESDVPAVPTILSAGPVTTAHMNSGPEHTGAGDLVDLLPHDSAQSITPSNDAPAASASPLEVHTPPAAILVSPGNSADSGSEEPQTAASSNLDIMSCTFVPVVPVSRDSILDIETASPDAKPVTETEVAPDSGHVEQVPSVTATSMSGSSEVEPFDASEGLTQNASDEVTINRPPGAETADKDGSPALFEAEPVSNETLADSSDTNHLQDGKAAHSGDGDQEHDKRATVPHEQEGEAEATSVRSPVSSVLATAQSTVTSTAASIGSMATAILPAYLVGDAHATQDIEDNNAYEPSQLGSIAQSEVESSRAAAEPSETQEEEKHKGKESPEEPPLTETVTASPKTSGIADDHETDVNARDSLGLRDSLPPKEVIPTTGAANFETREEAKDGAEKAPEADLHAYKSDSPADDNDTSTSSPLFAMFDTARNAVTSTAASIGAMATAVLPVASEEDAHTSSEAEPVDESRSENDKIHQLSQEHPELEHAQPAEAGTKHGGTSVDPVYPTPDAQAQHADASGTSSEVQPDLSALLHRPAAGSASPVAPAAEDIGDETTQDSSHVNTRHLESKEEDKKEDFSEPGINDTEHGLSSIPENDTTDIRQEEVVQDEVAHLQHKTMPAETNDAADIVTDTNTNEVSHHDLSQQPAKADQPPSQAEEEEPIRDPEQGVAAEDDIPIYEHDDARHSAQLHEHAVTAPVHIATPVQTNTTQAMTTSPVSGLPIRVSEAPTEKASEDGHTAFHRAGATPGMHDIQPATLSDIKQPAKEEASSLHHTLPLTNDHTSNEEMLQGRNAPVRSETEDSLKDMEAALLKPSRPPRLSQRPADEVRDEADRQSLGSIDIPENNPLPSSKTVDKAQLEQDEPKLATTALPSLVPDHLLGEIEARKEKLHPQIPVVEKAPANEEM